jgi:excisionase family DNA binding protein
VNDLLTVTEVMNRLHVSRGTVYALVNDGSLPVVKIRNATRFTPDAVDELVAKSVRRAEGFGLRDHRPRPSIEASLSETAAV